MKKKKHMTKFEADLSMGRNPTRKGLFKLEDKKAKVLSKKALK